LESTGLENKNHNTPGEDEDVLLGIPAYNEELSIGSVHEEN